MTYTNVLALALLVAVPVAGATLWVLFAAPTYLRARHRRASKARLAAAIRNYGADGWRAQDASTLWYRGVDR